MYNFYILHVSHVTEYIYNMYIQGLCQSGLSTADYALFLVVIILIIIILQRADPLLGNDREINNETSAARKPVLNKQIYATVTE
jgi:hypothetical protein